MVHRLILKIGIAAALACAPPFAPAADPDPAEVLRRAARKALDTANHIPNYTCVETVERRYYHPAAAILPRDCAVLMTQRLHPTPDLVLRLFSTDRLRLDVTLAQHGEIFSWAGASRFADGDVDQVVRRGPFGTGSFGAYLSDIFSRSLRTFTFRGATANTGRNFFEYAFAFNRSQSHLRLKTNDGWVYHGYGGTFQVDAATGDIVSMVLTSSGMPIAAQTCQISTTLDFGTVRIGDSGFQLPQKTRQHFILPNAEEAENITTFSECREYRGESTVTFEGQPQPGAGPAAAAGAPAALPVGLTFSLSLTAPIRTATAAAGDIVPAKLTEPLRDFEGKVLAPKGARVDLRLLRVQSFTEPPEVVVVLRPRSVWIHGARVPLRGNWTPQRLSSDRRHRIPKGSVIVLPLRSEENAGAFRFRGQHPVIPAGFITDWRTAPFPSRTPRH